MCAGVKEGVWDIAVRDEVAAFSREGKIVLEIPVLVLAELYRKGMAQHRRERVLSAKSPAELAAQSESLEA